MRLIPIESVKEGSYLGRTLFDDDGRILLSEGTELSANLIKRIREINIYSVYVNDEYSNKEINDVIKPELRQKAIKTVKTTFCSFEKFCSDIPVQGLSGQTLNLLLKKRSSYFAAISEVAYELIDDLFSKKNLFINLVDIKSMDNYTYQHSVNVAVLSLILGMQLQLSKPELANLCVGALIHDIGKVLIPKEIILKPASLTKEEFSIIKEHPLKGYNYLKNITEISSPSRVIVLQHHERFDGNGYPEKRGGSKISLLAKIVSIVDVYDALTSDRPYKRAMNPNDAIEYIMASSSSQFDYNLVKTFSKIIVPYPEGTLVKLSNEDYGVVDETSPHYPLRPKIKIVHSTAGRENLFIDLSLKLDVVITEIVHNIP